MAARPKRAANQRRTAVGADAYIGPSKEGNGVCEDEGKREEVEGKER